MTGLYALHGLVFRVEAHEEAAFSRTAAILAHFGALPAAGEPDLELRWGAGAVPVVEGREVARHLDGRAVRDASGALWLLGPITACRIEGRVARGVLAPGAELPLHVLTWVIVHQLRALGWYTVHAGAIARGEAGCLVVGESGAGKSTLTLAMIREGWSLLSDDSVLLRHTPAGPGAFALRRGVYLEPAAAARTFPTLEGRWHEVPLVEAVKHGLDAPEVAARQAERCLPSAVLFPTRSGQPVSRLEPLSTGETLFGLVQQSRLAELDSDGVAEHMRLLAEVAGAARGYRLHAGTDVFEAPSRVSALLAEVTR
ncbi:MAG: hypothetical protein H6737_29605 [Alphaproteobacteria bacterium]|nr:hypothetical protein [Alphaproteobacteria bacterium]